jgi:hypothetical protein
LLHILICYAEKQRCDCTAELCHDHELLCWGMAQRRSRRSPSDAVVGGGGPC